MKRIEPTHFIEVWKSGFYEKLTKQTFREDVKSLLEGIELNRELGCKTIAIFGIQPQTTSLAERMERREMKECEWVVGLYCKENCCQNSYINQTQLK